MTNIRELGLVAALDKGPVICAEGYLFEMERRGYLKAGPFVPEVVLDFPQAVKQLHEEFVRAGSDVVVAFTYYGHRAKLKAIGKEDLLEELNRNALAIARIVAHETGTLLAGNLSNTWEYEPDSKQSRKTVRAIFDEQVAWAVDEQADFIIAETFGHLGEALLALESIKSSGKPAVITFSPATGSSCDGYSWEDACKVLQDAGADVVGLNCGNGPDTMTPHIERIRHNVSVHVAALPVPYRTSSEQPCFQKLRLPDNGRAFPVALDRFLLSRYEMAEFAVNVRDMGIRYIGICCGAGPHHVRSMSEALGKKPAASRYSPDMSLHPIFGETNVKENHVACLLGPVID
ncbi:MAG: homocysteine S-methyltransferase family protein [Desulfobacterales bacterium]